jgi:hypothetical protein
MFKLTSKELDDAFKAIAHHGYSTLIPPPPEWSVVSANWKKFRSELCDIDLDIYTPLPVMRLYAPKSRINLRPVSLLQVQTGDIVNTSPGTSFTPGGCPGWKRMW